MGEGAAGTRRGSGELVLRFATAGVGLPVVLGLNWLGGWFFCLLITVAGALAAAEYLLLALGRRAPVPLVVDLLAAVGLLLSVATGYFQVHALVLLLAGLLVMWTVHLLFPGPIPGAAGRAATAIVGALTVGAMFACLVLLRQREHGAAWVVVTLAITWGGDTAAYFTGRALGRHKLYPAVSPGKSWEGFLGGLFGAMLAAVICWVTFFPELGLLLALAVGAVGGVVGPIGDLSESLLKRSVGVKDSGRLLPGHGGMLDRVDALLFVAPAVWLLLQFVG